MAWTWEQIEQDWLGDGRIAVPHAAAVDAFNRVERVLGREWMTGCRGSTGNAAGTAPTLCVVTKGQLLLSLDGVRDTEKLLDKIRRGDHSATAELTGIYLLSSGRTDTTVELEPEVSVAGRNKRPDFCISLSGVDGAFVEVTQPNMSEDQVVAHTVLERITAEATRIKKGFALEAFLRRVPTEQEVTEIIARLPTFCIQDGTHRQDLGNLGFLMLNLDTPGRVEVRSHEGEENRPRLCQAKAISGPDEPHRHIVVRLAFSDERAQQFLEAEAKQLPKETPGLIMMQMSRAPGGFKTWEPILRRRLQPKLHTRVSAICLFQSGLEWTTDGEAWIPHTKLLVNPHAKIPLPEWIVKQLNRFASE